MDTSPHTLATLFSRLGLPDTAAAIDDFIAGHRLPDSLTLADAPFWTPAQAALLREAIHQDAEWAEAADELAARLSARRLT